MSHAPRPMLALLVLAPLLALAPLTAVAHGEPEAVPFFFHSGSRMDGNPGERAAHDPSTFYASWHEAAIVYRATDLQQDLVIVPEDAFRLALYRVPVEGGEYVTRVIVSVFHQGERTVIADHSTGAVEVEGAHPPESAALLAPADPRDGPAGGFWPGDVRPDFSAVKGPFGSACDATAAVCRGDPDLGYRVPSLLDLASRQSSARWKAANGALDEQTTPSPAAPLQPGWGDIVIDLAEGVVVPAGADLEVRIVTRNAQTPVFMLPQPLQDRFDWSAAWRPEILNWHDAAEYPARLEVMTLH